MKKNINTRLDEEVFYEIQAASWFLDISRSNLVRDMIEYFRTKGVIRLGEQEYTYQSIVELSFQKLEEQNIQVQDLITGKIIDNEASLPPSEIQELAKVHVKSIKKAWLELIENETISDGERNE